LTHFVDTSALYALLDGDDRDHRQVADAFEGLAGDALLTHNYVVVESAALVERRLGLEHARRLLLDILAPVEVVWVDESIHRAATSAYFASGTRGPSLVDFTSFEVMRLRSIRQVLALDRHFAEAGFELLVP
jgi:predicted nucleic acid-binding protein